VSKLAVLAIRCYLMGMSISLTSYWQNFVEQLIASGRYNNQSEVIRAGLRALEEQEQAREVREFDQVFAGGRTGEPDESFIEGVVQRQRAYRKKRR
jgi:antitoxin ParD1/3/4